jgi:hypothetical protein
MTSRHQVPVAIKKELRALGPSWLVCLALITAASLMDPYIAHDLTMGVSVLGAIALGALSIGHEYSGGTLSLLLSQPGRRGHILLLKASALVPILATLGAFAFAVTGRSRNAQGVLFAMPLLCGLFIAPWFTMLCRSSLAAIVFTTAIPGLLLLIGEVAAALRFGVPPVPRRRPPRPPSKRPCCGGARLPSPESLRLPAGAYSCASRLSTVVVKRSDYRG